MSTYTVTAITTDLFSERPEPPRSPATPSAAEQNLPETATPAIPAEVAKLLTFTQTNETTVTPREINAQLSKVLDGYDELTALFGENSRRISAELEVLRQTGGHVSGRVHQLSAEMAHQTEVVDRLSAHTETRLSELHQRVGQDVATLDSGLRHVREQLAGQDRLLGEQQARLDQFDAAYTLLDTATRGNRQRIESVREATEKQHAIVTAQVDGLTALQRHHYAELESVHALTVVLQRETQRLEHAIQDVALDLAAHVTTTRHTFNLTHLGMAGLLLLALAGLVLVALVRWSPSFAPVSSTQAIAQTQERVAVLSAQMSSVDALRANSAEQQVQVGQVASKLAHVEESLQRLQASVASLAGTTVAAPVVHDGQWLLQQSPAAYTVQLLGVPAQASMAQFLATHGATLSAQPLAYSVTERDGQERYNLFYGVFPSVAEARRAIAALPSDVRANQPWVRQLGEVQAAFR